MFLKSILPHVIQLFQNNITSNVEVYESYLLDTTFQTLAYMALKEDFKVLFLKLLKN